MPYMICIPNQAPVYTTYIKNNHPIIREWRVIADEVQTNYHGRTMVL